MQIPLQNISVYVTDDKTYQELTDMLAELNTKTTQLAAQIEAKWTVIKAEIALEKTNLQTVINAVEEGNPVIITDLTLNRFNIEEKPYFRLKYIVIDLKNERARILKDALANKNTLITNVTADKTTLQEKIDAVEPNNPVTIPDMTQYTTDGKTYTELQAMQTAINNHITRIPADALATKNTLITNITADKSTLQKTIDSIESNNPVTIPDMTQYVTEGKTYTELQTMQTAINNHITRIPADALANKNTLITNITADKSTLQNTINAVEANNPEPPRR